ncbi:hypothetical protein HDV03_003606 [Kappamyces sp. JEL0829]|nr:hypothetical protein HDV03_003606 [Kappamyces sp. JEL0829]
MPSNSYPKLDFSKVDDRWKFALFILRLAVNFVYLWFLAFGWRQQQLGTQTRYFLFLLISVLQIALVINLVDFMTEDISILGWLFTILTYLVSYLSILGQLEILKRFVVFNARLTPTNIRRAKAAVTVLYIITNSVVWISTILGSNTPQAIKDVVVIFPFAFLVVFWVFEAVNSVWISKTLITQIMMLKAAMQELQEGIRWELESTDSPAQLTSPQEAAQHGADEPKVLIHYKLLATVVLCITCDVLTCCGYFYVYVLNYTSTATLYSLGACVLAHIAALHPLFVTSQFYYIQRLKGDMIKPVSAPRSAKAATKQVT